MIPAPRDGERQPREQPCPCSVCGFYKSHGRLVARTLTWNPSGLCNGHEAAQLAREACDAARDAVERLVAAGCGRQIAEQIITRAGGRP